MELENHIIRYDSFKKLPKGDQELIQKAEEACKTAYAPYSNFHVGAAFLLENGETHQASNQENAAYPDGLCAERVGLFYLGSNKSAFKIFKLAVTARRQSESHFIGGTPCGSCRQVMVEFENRQKHPIEILMKVENEQWVKTKNSKILLPFSFDRDSLNMKS